MKIRGELFEIFLLFRTPGNYDWNTSIHLALLFPYVKCYLTFVGLIKYYPFSTFAQRMRENTGILQNTIRFDVIHVKRSFFMRSRIFISNRYSKFDDIVLLFRHDVLSNRYRLESMFSILKIFYSLFVPFRFTLLLFIKFFSLSISHFWNS